ncbi:MOSC domain-containing protein YiiM [Desmospora activa DSM 45169]|uniref:MOSC domain-containing protein YiiM n=2 Tax=Desmospora TaxID=500614 RepID=A0A2T4ZB16_9BACL|nr:MOSC domain-containing protein YiiM [Desmospora activa DSM 45169]
MKEATIVHGIHVGLPQSVGTLDAADPMDRRWTSAIFKQPVKGSVYLEETGLVGDGVADRKHHGGPDKAVLVYPSTHYPRWREELQRPDIAVGAFGENFLVAGMTEESVCIGDIFQLGDATVQVSQPRQPCWKPARRIRVKDLAVRIRETGRTGWYLRVLKTGLVEAGQSLRLLDRPYPQWTITRCNDLMYGHHMDPQAITELAACPLLAPAWAKGLKR